MLARVDDRSYLDRPLAPDVRRARSATPEAQPEPSQPAPWVAVRVEILAGGAAPGRAAPGRAEQERSEREDYIDARPPPEAVVVRDGAAAMAVSVTTQPHLQSPDPRADRTRNGNSADSIAYRGVAAYRAQLAAATEGSGPIVGSRVYVRA